MTGARVPVFIGGDGDVTIKDCTFDNCASRYGAMRIYTSGSATIDNCKLLNTKSSNGSYSSAIGFGGSSTSDWTISNTVIDGSSISDASTATYIFGAIYNEKSSGTVALDNVTIRNCNLDKANGLIATKGDMTIKNSTLVDNYVYRDLDIAGFIFVSGGKTVTIETSIIQNNSKPNYFLTANSSSASFNLNYNNIQGNTFNTAFTHPDNGTYTLDANYWGPNGKPDGVTASTLVVENNGVYELSDGKALEKSIPGVIIVITNDNITDYFDYDGDFEYSNSTPTKGLAGEGTDNEKNTKGGYFLKDAVATGSALYFKGNFIPDATGNFNPRIIINKRVSITSTDKSAVFMPYISKDEAIKLYWNFGIIAGADYTEVKNLKFENCWVFNHGSSYVTFDGIDMKVEDANIGSGTGDLSILTTEEGAHAADHTTVKNSTFYFKNNAGASGVAAGRGAPYATFHNNNVTMEGNVGNALYATPYSGKGDYPEFATFTNNVITNTGSPSPICYGLASCGQGNLIENNTVNYAGSAIVTPITIFGGPTLSETSAKNTYRNNTTTLGGSMNVQNYSVIENNQVSGSLTVAQGATATGNTAASMKVSGQNATVKNNTVNGNVTISKTTAAFTDNAISGTLTVSGTNNTITGNVILSSEENAIVLNSADNTVSGNILISADHEGDAAVKTSKTNTIADNTLAAYESATAESQSNAPYKITSEATTLTAGDNAGTFYYVPTNAKVTINGELAITLKTGATSPKVNLMLGDGAKLNVGNISGSDCSLAIYGQSGGTGSLTANATSRDGIKVGSGAVTIYGGKVTVTNNNTAISGGSLYVYGGDFTATGGSGESYYGVSSSSAVIGWTNPSDKVCISSYNGESFSIVSEKTFYDGMGTNYSGQLLSGSGPQFADVDALNAAIGGKILSQDNWGIADGNDGSETKPYIIRNTAGLDLLAANVNNGIDYKDKYFKLANDITYTYNDKWDDKTSTENNYIAIGKYVSYDDQKFFSGTFDGNGKTISGIRIYKNNGQDPYGTDDGYQGIFGIVDGGTVKNVTLADTRISGKVSVGGIVGGTLANESDALIDNCHVLGNVALHALVGESGYVSSFGGIAGSIQVSFNLPISSTNVPIISSCTSAATLTIEEKDNYSSISGFGGIVGFSQKSVLRYNLAQGCTIPDVVKNTGAIIGCNYSDNTIENNYNTIENNYYSDCTIGEKYVGIGSGGDYSSTGSDDITDNDGAMPATILSDTKTSLPALDEGTKVAFRREFTGGKASTVVFPFDYTPGEEGTYYAFSGVTYDDVEGKWIATMTSAVTPLTANTPYLFMPAGNDIPVPVLFHGEAASSISAGTTVNSDWSFKGVFEKKTWTSADCGRDYGFAATSGKATDGETDVAAGDFVKLEEGAWIRPMRAYLTYNSDGNPWATTNAPRRTGSELPQSISVVLINSDGSTTKIATTNFTNFTNSDEWFTLDGRQLTSKPTAKGIYIVNGRKVAIK